MKRIFALVTLLLVIATVNAQTAKELIGKWKLVSWKDAMGKEKDIVSFYKTDQVYQVFDEDNKFQSLVGEKTTKGKWKLSDDNKELTIKAGIANVKFDIVSFDEKKRVISSQYGTFSYEKQ